jgi:hypothetical protein
VGEKRAAVARMQLPSRDIRHKEARTSNTSKKAAIIMQIAAVATTQIITRLAMQTIRRRGSTGTRISPCINQKVPRIATINNLMLKVAAVASPSNHTVNNNISRRDRRGRAIIRETKGTRSTVIEIIIISRIVIENRAVMTSSRIKIKVLDECHSIQTTCNSSSTSKTCSK